MTNLRDQLQSTLGTAYRIERELGGGGMSYVFLAEETTLGRRVVVKVLPSDLSGGISIARFRREITLAAQLQHPHIVPLLAAGDVDGLPFYTMPFVEGDSLRSRLTRGELAIPEALSILRDVARALEYAHTKGVVHRDIKPENVLLAGRSAVVTDFGVAKALTEATAGTELTSAGVALGTPAYMAPEQAAGDPASDHRADIYSFGILAYELLGGHTPFAGRSAQATLAAQAIETPVPLERVRPTISPAIAELVGRCLEKRLGDRPQSMADVIRSLESVPLSDDGRVARPKRRLTRAGPALVVVGLLAVVAVGIAVARRFTSAAAPQTLAVLPFENASGDSAEDYFADGMTDEIASSLSGVPGLRVAARTSSYSFKARHVAPLDIARTLGVGVLVQGTVRRLGAKLHVTAELVNASSGLSEWSATYDREVQDSYAVQHEITGSIIEALQTALTRDKLEAALRSTTRHETSNPEAHDLYLRGRHAADAETRAGLNTAIALFQQALVKDPQYALAYSGMADAYNDLGDTFVPPDSAYPRALAAARQAIAIDSLLGPAWSSLAIIEINLWHFPSGRAAIDRALVLNPDDVRAHIADAYYLTVMSRGREAIKAARRAVEIDPVAIPANAVYMNIAASFDEPDSAIAQYERFAAVGRADDLRAALGVVYLMKKDYARADSVFRADSAATPTTRNVGIAIVDALTGKAPEAHTIVRAVSGGWPRVYIAPEFIALTYAALGERDSMYAWLERGVAIHSGQALSDVTMLPFKPYRNEPRFRALLSRIGLPTSTP